MTAPTFFRSCASSVSEEERTLQPTDRRYELPSEGSFFAFSTISLSLHSPTTPPRSLSWRRIEPVLGSPLDSSDGFYLQGMREFERKNFGKALNCFICSKKLEPTADKNLLFIVGLMGFGDIQQGLSEFENFTKDYLLREEFFKFLKMPFESDSISRDYPIFQKEQFEFYFSFKEKYECEFPIAPLFFDSKIDENKDCFICIHKIHKSLQLLELKNFADALDILREFSEEDCISQFEELYLKACLVITWAANADVDQVQLALTSFKRCYEEATS